MTKESQLNKIRDYITKNELGTKCRERKLVDRRAYLYYYMVSVLDMSLTKIGLEFNKHHATIIHGLKSYDALKDTKEFSDNIEDVEDMFSLNGEIIDVFLTDTLLEIKSLINLEIYLNEKL